MKIAIVTPDGVEERDMTAEEISAKETQDAANTAAKEADEANRVTKENLITSAKAKLVAGEALTEDEANTIVFR
tara:strand:+ start:519 stop:740 length:222 start_codon:yes stop_codon:yes gene_type:complete